MLCCPLRCFVRLQMVTDFGGGPYTKLLAHLKKSAAAGVTSAQLDERMAAQVGFVRGEASWEGGKPGLDLW